MSMAASVHLMTGSVKRLLWKTIMNTQSAAGSFAILAWLTLSASTPGQGIELSRSKLGAGGGVSAGDDWTLTGTIGQADAGTLDGGDLQLSGGFWFPQSAGDCNADGSVNLFDYQAFAECVTGPGGSLPEASCACFDADVDRDVDFADFGSLQTGFGP